MNRDRETSANGPFPTFRRLKRLIKPAVKLILALIVVVLIVHSVLLVVWGRQFENRVAQIRAKGQPVDCAELVPKPVPDDRNAAVVLQKAFDFIKQTRMVGGVPQTRYDSKVDSKLFIDPSRDSAIRQTVEPQVRAEIQSKQRVFPLVRQALARPECVFPVRWQDGAAAMFPHTSPLRQIGRLIAAKAVVDAEDGKLDESLDDVSLGLELARKTAGEPILISYLVNAAITDYAVDGLQLAVRTHPLSYEQASKMYGKLDGAWLQPSFKRAMEGERTITNWMFTEARNNPEAIPSFLGTDPYSEPGPIRHAMHRVSCYMRRPLLYKDQMISLDKWDRQMQLIPLTFKEIRARNISDLDDAPRWAIMSRVFFPVFVGCWSRRDAAAARLGMGQVAMALKAYKAKSGSYPESLDGLKAYPGWKLPIDPFSGRPFVYHRRGEGFILYSFGQNLKDDGGKTSRELGRKNDPNTNMGLGDLVWVCEK